MGQSDRDEVANGDSMSEASKPVHVRVLGIIASEKVSHSFMLRSADFYYCTAKRPAVIW
jgi:hypothetical protein